MLLKLALCSSYTFHFTEGVFLSTGEIGRNARDEKEERRASWEKAAGEGERETGTR